MKFSLCWDTMGGSSWQITRSAAASPPFLQSLQWHSGVTSVHIPNLSLHKALLGSAGSESCRQALQIWARLENQGNIFRQKILNIFRQNVLKSIWKDLIRIFNPSSPITVLWWWHRQPYTLRSQSLNFVAVLASQSLNSCGQVIPKLEPRAHKWQPFRRGVKEVKCTFTVHFAGTGIEVIFQSSDRQRAKLSCSIFSQTLNPLSDETGPSVLLVQLLQGGSDPSVCLATNSTSSPRIFLLAARALPQPLCCVSHHRMSVSANPCTCSEKIWAGSALVAPLKKSKIKCYPQRKLKNKADRMNHVCVSQAPVLCYS